MPSLHGVLAAAAAAFLSAAGLGSSAAPGARAPEERPRDRARIVISAPLPQLDGSRLKVVLVEVHYGPGESSKPHSHPCPVVGYVAAGSLRTRVAGEPEAVYKAG